MPKRIAYLSMVRSIPEFESAIWEHNKFMHKDLTQMITFILSIHEPSWNGTTFHALFSTSKCWDLWPSMILWRSCLLAGYECSCAFHTSAYILQTYHVSHNELLLITLLICNVRVHIWYFGTLVVLM